MPHILGNVFRFQMYKEKGVSRQNILAGTAREVKNSNRLKPHGANWELESCAPMILRTWKRKFNICWLTARISLPSHSNRCASTQWRLLGITWHTMSGIGKRHECNKKFWNKCNIWCVGKENFIAKGDFGSNFKIWHSLHQRAKCGVTTKKIGLYVNETSCVFHGDDYNNLKKFFLFGCE